MRFDEFDVRIGNLMVPVRSRILKWTVARTVMVALVAAKRCMRAVGERRKHPPPRVFR